MSDPLAQTRQSMADLLRSPACAGLSFRYRACVVNGRQYAQVAADLLTNSISLERLEPGTNASAQYNARHCYVQTGFMTIPGLWRIDAPTCVHEMTHAVYDQQCLGRQPALDSEIVAYVAEKMFCMRAGIASGISDPISAAASGVARFLAGNPGSSITEDMASSLLTALRGNAHYSPQRNLFLSSAGIGRCP